MKKKLLCEFHLFVLILLCLTSVASSREKITMAVLDFEAKNVTQSNAEAVTDLLRTELFNTGNFKVVERQRIQKILEEQRFQMSGMTDANQAVEIGRLLNVQKIMIGTLTKLGTTHIINTRIVDVRTGLVILAEAAESRGGEDMLPRSIAELAMSISYKVGLEGSVIRIDGNEIFIDLGSADGVKIGQRFEIIRLGEAITDLEGHIIGTSDETIGIVIITKVQDRFAVAGIEKRYEDFNKGDKVQPLVEDGSEVKVQPRIKKPKKEEREEDDQPGIAPIF